MVRRWGKMRLWKLDDAMPLSFFFENLLKTHMCTPEGKIALKKSGNAAYRKHISDDQSNAAGRTKDTGEFDRFKLQQDITKANQGRSKLIPRM